MKNITKKQRKLSLDTLSIRPLVDFRGVAGGRAPNWTTTTDRCTHDLFCPTASGACP